MADRQLLKPDLDFVRELKQSGGDTLKKCFQCATCSVVCNLSPDKKPFPRKEMIWAGWGLKDKLMGNPDVWLCHQCNDCSEYCPRGAKPGDVLAAIRAYSFSHYSVPGFLGKMLRKAALLPILLAIPVALFLGLMGALGHLKIPEGEIIFKKFLPYHIVDPVFITISVLVMLSFAIGIKKFWGDMSKGIHPAGSEKGSVIGGLISTVITIMTHKQFGDCDKNKFRMLAHMLIFYGFAALAVVTGLVFLSIYLLDFKPLQPPLNLMNPVKILANVGAAILLLGTLIVIAKRISENKDKSKSSYFDWALIIMILLVTITGILTEVFRLSNMSNLAYPTYFVHLICVFYIIAYLPFSKLAHMVYRTVAMVYSNMIKREA